MCHAGASSKALMAFLPEAEIEAIVREKGLPKLCTNTITKPEALKTELALIRERGYAVSLEETDPGAWGVAAPIRGWSGDTVGAVGVAGPTLRYDEARLQQYVICCRAAARKVSSFLQHECQPSAFLAARQPRKETSHDGFERQRYSRWGPVLAR